MTVPPSRCLSHNGLIMTTQSDSQLTKREKEVVLKLAQGGRVATIAEQLGISPRTVSNHLKSSFWKLGVHSQTELIALAHSEPERLGLESPAATPLAMDELEERFQDARDKLVERVENAYEGAPDLSQLRNAVRAALPLDADRRQEWRDWLELRARSDAEGHHAGDPQQGLETWRKMNTDRLYELQEAGLLRDELKPEELLATIGALAVGAGARLVGNASEDSEKKELSMIDAFIDSLGVANRS